MGKSAAVVSASKATEKRELHSTVVIARLLDWQMEIEPWMMYIKVSKGIKFTSKASIIAPHPSTSMSEAFEPRNVTVEYRVKL
jgi:hypothetical protein